MLRALLKLGKWTFLVVLIFLVSLLAIRAWDSQRGAPLATWQTYVPHELTAAQIDATDWPGYLAAEQRVFDEVRRQVTEKLKPSERVLTNRYYEGAPMYPGHFVHDWNRSYVLEPAGKPVGAVVLIHGLTDAPYSLRNIAELYRARGFVAIGLRVPGHGTVPAALTKAQWPDWMAATRLAMREARRRVGPQAPIHMVGYSNGGALAVKYTMDAIEQHDLPMPTRLVLLSPMIGVTRFARFAGLAGLPAVLPAFAKAAWLDLLPEYNPFKYNSFPVNAARQTYLLTDVVRRQLQRLARDHRLSALPPMLTFQSVVDDTVSAPAVTRTLYAQLPDNGSEIVLFDVNRNRRFDSLLSESSRQALQNLLPPAPRLYRTTVVTNAAENDSHTVARITEPRQVQVMVTPLSILYPDDIFSLSHIALPFPPNDPLYGTKPDPSENFGIHLGTQAPRGERGALVLDLDAVLRISSNPFYPYVHERIDGVIPSSTAGQTPSPTAAR
ncbi:alpha/beta hydrolase [Dyella solisilvae]|uniref:Alpha/beta hydrolase n=1 Tax=Dyella solisilvae TaxID=1920168 RepID=A0A370K8N3_9GAMM|nr:alpha/beta hydrolase [Dyella solisilvae]RDI98400.1 alpha/beta hydrolase [Dyella solisilvae]